MKPEIFYVDFNEMIRPDVVLFSQNNTKNNIAGLPVKIVEGMLVLLYEDDIEENGIVDNLDASGKIIRNDSRGWGSHVKWCCKIDDKGIRHESES